MWNIAMTVVPAVSDPYEILQVQRGAEPEVIRAAYRALAAKWHPDRGATPERMVALNAAWKILGDPVTRAAFDAASAIPSHAPSSYAPPVPAPAARPPAGQGGGLPTRPPRETPIGDSLLDFGRYAGWRVSQIVEHDPDYAVWLARTPIGRRLATEIDAALVRREARARAMAPDPQTARRPLLRRRMSEAR